MRIEDSIHIDAPQRDVWEIVSTPSGLRRFIAGVTRWDVEGERDRGMGARYAVRMQVGSAQVGGLVEVVEFEEPCDLAWTSITGIDQRGRWRLRTCRDGGTEVTFRIVYRAPGGLLADLADRLSAPVVAANVRASLARLKAVVEDTAVEAPRSSLPRPLALARQAGELAFDGIDLLGTFTASGLIRPLRPDRGIRAALGALRWGISPAAGYAAGAALHPDRPAIVDELGTLSWADVDARTNRLANAWADAGIGPGDGIGIMCRNHRGFIEATVAAAKLGANALYLNTSFAGPQLTEVAKREKPVAIVYDEEFAELLADAGRRRKRYVAWHGDPDGPDLDDPTLESLIAGAPDDLPASPPEPGRQTILTSGTTGTPKGASRAGPTGPEPLVAILSKIPLRQGETTLIAAPLFHAWGLAHFMLALPLGSTIVLQRRFDPEATLSGIAQHRATACPMVPVMLQRILELPEEVRGRYDTSTLRVVPVSGSALSGDLAARFMDAFGDVVYNLYGSTEVAWATIATPRDLRRAPGTAGRPPRGTIVRIVDEDGLDLPTGQTGRIVVGNDMLFEGYTGGGSKDVVDGLMATGDVGHLDHAGRLFVDGRDDDMIVSGGENVFPQEIEDLLGAHPDIAEAAVVGVDDEKFGQRLKAFVVARNGKKLSADEVKAHVKSNLARYKVPRDVEFLDELPRTSTGKVLKRELQAD